MNDYIGINHGFQCSNIRWITRKVFEHKAHVQTAREFHDLNMGFAV